MVQKYTEFINEAKKDDAKAEIIKMLDSKPTITMSSDKWPTEKGIYSQSAIIKFLKGKFTTDQVLGGLNDLNNDKKSDLKNIKVKNYYYNETYPYYFMGLTEDEAKKAKESYEEKNEVTNKGAIDKKKAVTKMAAKKEEEKKRPAKKVAAKKMAAKKVAKK